MWIGTGTSMIKAGVLRFTPVMTGSDRAVHPFGGKEPGLQLAQAYAAGCSSCSGPYPCSKSVLGPKRRMPEALFEMTEKSSSCAFKMGAFLRRNSPISRWISEYPLGIY